MKLTYEAGFGHDLCQLPHVQYAESCASRCARAPVPRHDPARRVLT